MIKTCSSCGLEKKIVAKDLCMNCYSKNLKASNSGFAKRQRENSKQFNRAKRRNIKERLSERFSSKCIICGRDKRLTFHEADGKPHKPFTCMSSEEFEAILKTGDFLPLCHFHHNLLHR